MDYIYKTKWNSHNLAQFYWHAKKEKKNEDNKKLIFPTNYIIKSILFFFPNNSATEENVFSNRNVRT
jgi:hypothetical protein